MNITDIATAVDADAKQEVIGIRPGEKIHEQMIGYEDALTTFEYENHYKILPTIHGWAEDKARIKDGEKVDRDFIYSSDQNDEWMSIEELQEWIKSQEQLNHILEM
jgi:FlaA1/EpsC-like NDP-sugar epimerase